MNAGDGSYVKGGRGGTALEREFQLTLTDVDAVRRTIAATRAS